MWAHCEAVSSSSSDQRSCRPLARLPGLWVCALIRPGCISLCLASITVAPAGAARPGRPISAMVSPLIRMSTGTALRLAMSRSLPPRTMVKGRLGLMAILHCCNKVPPRREESHVSSPFVGEEHECNPLVSPSMRMLTGAVAVDVQRRLGEARTERPDGLLQPLVELLRRRRDLFAPDARFLCLGGQRREIDGQQLVVLNDHAAADHDRMDGRAVLGMDQRVHRI